jgi:hypothetical protein
MDFISDLIERSEQHSNYLRRILVDDPAHVGIGRWKPRVYPADFLDQFAVPGDVEAVGNSSHSGP